MKKLLKGIVVASLAPTILLAGCGDGGTTTNDEAKTIIVTEAELESQPTSDNQNQEQQKREVSDLDVNDVKGSSVKDLMAQAAFTNADDDATFGAINKEVLEILSDKSSEGYKTFLNDYKSERGAEVIVEYLSEHINDSNQKEVYDYYMNVTDKLNLIQGDFRIYSKGSTSIGAVWYNNAKIAIGEREGVDNEDYFNQYDITEQDLKEFVDSYEALGQGINDEELNKKRSDLTIKFLEEKLLTSIKINPNWREKMYGDNGNK